MKKSEYRDFFAKCKDFIKLNYFCKKCNISLSNLSVFIKFGDYNALSEEKLNILYNEICDTFNGIV